MEFVLLHTYIDKENIMKEYCMRKISMLSTYSLLITSHLSCMHSKYKNKMIFNSKYNMRILLASCFKEKEGEIASK